MIAAGRKRLTHFVRNILPYYDKTRNDPSVDGTSRLSPYLHFGFGKHDRPWFEREIFGTIRYMTSRSMAKKFNARRYMGSV